MNASEEREQGPVVELGDGERTLRIRRRDFLAWGGAAALLPSIEGIARAESLLAGATAATAQPPQPMSVGYIVGSDTWSPLRNVTAGYLLGGIIASAGANPTPAEVTPAVDLIAGSQELAGQSVRMRVHGLYPVPNPQGVGTVYLTALFSGVDAGLPDAVPYLAWGYKAKPAPDIPPPVAFPYPLGPEGKLSLRLEAAPMHSGALARRPSLSTAPGGTFTTTFTVDWFAGQPKLQRGVYLLGLTGNTWSSARTLPIVKRGQQRPLELVSLVVSFDPIAA